MTHKLLPLDPVDAKVREDHETAVRENRIATKQVRLAAQALRWVLEHPKPVPAEPAPKTS